MGHTPLIAPGLDLSRTNVSAVAVGIESVTALSPAAALNMIKPLKTGFDSLNILDDTRIGAAGLRTQPLAKIPARKSPLVTFENGPVTSPLTSIPQITSGWGKS